MCERASELSTAMTTSIAAMVRKKVRSSPHWFRSKQSYIPLCNAAVCDTNLHQQGMQMCIVIGQHVTKWSKQ